MRSPWPIAIVALVAIAWLAFYFAAPCRWLGWMPVKDLPARCFEGKVAR